MVAFDMEEQLPLLVRSITGRHPDLRLRASPAWTVRRLKAELRRLVPEDPPEEDQKLIYAGKLLHDHHCLRELLPKHRELHALHLVYNLKTPANMQASSAKVKAEQPKLSVGASQEPSASSSDAARPRCCSGGQASGEARNRLERTLPPFQNVTPGFSAYTTYSMLQMSWFQQVYARLYYMQYLASLGASADQSHAQGSQEIPVTPPAPFPNPFPAQNQPGNQNAAAQVNAVANQNLQMNAQGGALMEEEEGGHRDWLDWLYSAILFYVFINIIYFYSNVRRFLLVLGGTVLMYLHHVGWFPFGQRPVQPFPGNAPPPAVNQDQNNNLQGGNAGRAAEPEASPEEGQVFQDLQEDDPSLMNTAWVFFKTFFASLLP